MYCAKQWSFWAPCSITIYYDCILLHYLTCPSGPAVMLSSVLNVVPTDMSVCSGRMAIMITIMMGKMEMVLPDMYMMNKFMGTCFSGPMATSHDRLALSAGSGLREAS